MTWLSKITLRQDSPELIHLVQQSLQDGYREHQMIWRFFSHLPEVTAVRGRRQDTLPSGEGDMEALFLYRQERERNQVVFYLLSQQAPQPEPLLWDCQSKPFAPQLQQGDRLAFRVRINPSQRRKCTPGEVKGKTRRIDLVAERKRALKQQYGEDWHRRCSQGELEAEVALSWLQQRAERCGFAIAAGDILQTRYERLQLQSAKGKQADPMILGVLDIEGELTVSDPARMQATLRNGLGSGKGFGLGLMLVRRLV